MMDINGTEFKDDEPVVLILEDVLGGIDVPVVVEAKEVERVLEVYRGLVLGQTFYGSEYCTREEWESERELFTASLVIGLRDAGVTTAKLIPLNEMGLMMVKPRLAWERPGFASPPNGYPVPKDAVRFRREAPIPGYI